MSDKNCYGSGRILLNRCKREIEKWTSWLWYVYNVALTEDDLNDKLSQTLMTLVGSLIFLPVSGDHCQVELDVFKWLSLPLGEHLSEDENK